MKKNLIGKQFTTPLGDNTVYTIADNDNPLYVTIEWEGGTRDMTVAQALHSFSKKSWVVVEQPQPVTTQTTLF